MGAKNKSNELKLSRIYDAPVKAVWDAWADPAQAAKWWGPRGFTITTHGKDLRAGGFWKYTMHGPDGVNYENTTIYHEVEKYSRLIYDHGGSADRPPLFRVTVTFTEVKGKTKLDMTMTLPTPEAAEETRKLIKKAGGDSTWDRLGEYLDKESTGQEEFIINRSFNVPMHTMFAMWTDAKHFSQWLPPTGFTMTFINVDIKPGGSSFYSMTNCEFTMYGKTKYLEISKPDRVVYLQEFADENGNMSRHPIMPTWPATMKTTVQLTEEGPEQTRVTVTWQPYGEVTAAEMESFVTAKAGMTQGWTGSFDKLEDYITK